MLSMVKSGRTLFKSNFWPFNNVNIYIISRGPHQTCNLDCCTIFKYASSIRRGYSIPKTSNQYFKMLLLYSTSIYWQPTICHELFWHQGNSNVQSRQSPSSQDCKYLAKIVRSQFIHAITKKSKKFLCK